MRALILAINTLICAYCSSVLVLRIKFELMTLRFSIAVEGYLRASNTIYTVLIIAVFILISSKIFMVVYGFGYTFGYMPAAFCKPSFRRCYTDPGS